MRRRYELAFAVTFLLALALPASGFAQAWIHDPGDGYLEANFRQISGDQYFNDDGDFRTIANTYTQSTVGIYGEVGVVPRWLMLTVDGELFRHNKLAKQGATSGLGDMGFGAWTGLLQDRFKLTAGVRLGFPTGDPKPTAPGDDTEADLIAATLPTGDGFYDVTGSLAWGISIAGEGWPIQNYLTGAVGYEYRTEGFQDALQWRFELGTRIPVVVLERIWFAMRISGLHPLGDGSGSSFSGLGANAAYVSPGFGIAADIYAGLGLKASVEGAVYAKNVIAAVPWQVGIYYDF